MSSSSFSSPSGFLRAWLLISSTVMMMGWARVARTLFRHWDVILLPNNALCLDKLTDQVRLALQFSFLEVFNAVTGITRSKWEYVLLFAMVRYGMEVYCAPALPGCNAWQHILTVLCWSVGDGIRFYCFVLDTLVPTGDWAKYVRYTVGPIIFPIGAAGELLMVVAVAQYHHKPYLYFVAALWPVFFAPLFRQLLRQRRKFISTIKEKAKIE